MSSAAGWYAVALSDGLEPGTSAGTRLFDKELVVWRDASGASHVWEDRCPHRGMRLSFGFVRGTHIACLYHGWQYDEAGQCRYIPAHPKLDVPETIRVATYASAEAMGMIWVRSDAGPSVPPPSNAPVIPVRSLYVDLPSETVAAGLEARSFARISPGLYSADVADTSVLLAVQPFTVDRTGLHLAIADSSPAVMAVAVWAEELRDALEAASREDAP